MSQFKARIKTRLITLTELEIVVRTSRLINNKSKRRAAGTWTLLHCAVADKPVFVNVWSALSPGIYIFQAELKVCLTWTFFVRHQSLTHTRSSYFPRSRRQVRHMQSVESSLFTKTFFFCPLEFYCEDHRSLVSGDRSAAVEVQT